MDVNIDTIKIQDPSLQGSFMFPCFSQIHFIQASLPLTLDLNLWQQGFCLYNCAISRMSYKWNHTLCNLRVLTFFTQGNFVEINPACYMYQ